MGYVIDEIDQQIMRLLQHHARMSVVQISKEVNMSQPSVKERILKLEENGIISEYSTIYDLEQLNRGTTTFILLKTEQCEEFVHFCQQAVEVTDLYRISGEYNYLIKVQTATIEELAKFQESLVKLGPSKSHISMKNIMEHRVLL